MKQYNLYDLFTAGLTLVFIHLKLSGSIDWSWWWVLSPIWINIAISFIASFIDAIKEEQQEGGNQAP